jgi:hypothetical protein
MSIVVGRRRHAGVLITGALACALGLARCGLGGLQLGGLQTADRQSARDFVLDDMFATAACATAFTTACHAPRGTRRILFPFPNFATETETQSQYVW